MTRAVPPAPAPWVARPPVRPWAPLSARPPALPPPAPGSAPPPAALVGGVGGYLYAEHKNNEIRDQQAAAAAYNYQPSQGNYVVNIDQAYVEPAVASPGQQVNLGMQYTMLTPAGEPASLTLVREVRYQGQLVGQPYQTTVSSPNGSFGDSVAYSLPTNAPPGNYTVTSRLVSSYGSAQKDSYFTVQ